MPLLCQPPPLCQDGLSQSLAEKLPDGDYRHLVVTLPNKMGLRKRLQRDARLYRKIGRLVHTVYAGWFANALGNLNPKPAPGELLPVEGPKPGKWVRWRTLILRCWAVDPELCPRCHKEMKRAKALLDQHELQRLLQNLGIGLYPVRHRSPPPPDPAQVTDQESQISEPDSQVPANWDDWEAA